MKDLSNIILNNKYQLISRIGSGSYGIVYSAIHLYTGIQYAVKIILKNNSPNTSNNKQLLVELEKSLIYQSLLNNGCLDATLLSLDSIEKHGTDCKFLREISLQLKVHKHPNVLSIYKVYDFQTSIFVVMDFYPDGDLFTTIVDKQRYKNDPFLIKSVFCQLVDALNYCHAKSVYHCDLKPENILVSDNGKKLILADFGLALQDKYIDSNISCGSSYYMSPERIQNFSQAFNTLESHSIHIERLLDPKHTKANVPAHGNVKFPTSAGDVWSLSIILINLISIRNPWLKASLHDTTFKAFVQNPKILMKILPISEEVFHILLKYLALNPWDRGNLFDFRSDVLHCRKLTETGPLSIDSSIQSLDIITTASQISMMDRSLSAQFEICPIPVDHVAIDRLRSGELDVARTEPENDYIPKPIINPLSTPIGRQPIKATGECKSCAECGFGTDSSCSSASSSSVIQRQASLTSSDYVLSTSQQIQDTKIPSHPYELQQQQEISQPPAQQVVTPTQPEHKHENMFKKFFKFGPGGYNANNLYTKASTPRKHHRHHLSPFKSSEKKLLSDQNNGQNENNMLLEQQQLQQQQQLHQRQQLQQLQLQKQQQQLQQLQQYQQQLLQLQQSNKGQKSGIVTEPQQGEHQHHHHHHHYHHHHYPSDQHKAPEAIPPVAVPAPVPDYTSIFPMPGMGLNKPILGQDRPKKKLITKRRQKRVGAPADKSTLAKRSANSKEQKIVDETKQQQRQSQQYLDQENGDESEMNSQLDYRTASPESRTYSQSTGESAQSQESEGPPSGEQPTVSTKLQHAQSNQYVNRIKASEIKNVSQTLSAMSIISNDSNTTMATVATRGSTMDQS